MKKNYNRSKGFTMVELAVVFVVACLLTIGMMFASGSSTDAATSALVKANLKKAKDALLAVYSNRVTLAKFTDTRAIVEEIYKRLDEKKKIELYLIAVVAGRVSTTNINDVHHIGILTDIETAKRLYNVDPLYYMYSKNGNSVPQAAPVDSEKGQQVVWLFINDPFMYSP